ncbi:hypothetical protein BY458DRAFT_504252 [Sporodiniella umbellata]|nr:hypothetical protein BY458DRAFT_504252 [Sporodiniella umbellata]
MKVTPGFSRVNSQTSNESCTEEIPVSQQLVQEPKEKRTFWDKCKTVFMYTKPLLMMMVFDVGLPLALARVVFTLIRRRRLDILGCVFVISYVISAILSVVTGDIRLTLLRDSAVTAMIGGLFLITLIPLKTRWTDRAGQEHSQSTPNFNWDHIKIYRLFAYATTAGWGTLLMGEFIAKVIMIKSIMPSPVSSLFEREPRPSPTIG